MGVCLCILRRTRSRNRKSASEWVVGVELAADQEDRKYMEKHRIESLDGKEIDDEVQTKAEEE